MPARNLWIIQDTGLNLVQDNFQIKEEEHLDETVLGGFTAAIFNITSTIASGIDTGIDAIRIGDRVLNYYAENGIIVCLDVDKKDKEKRVKEAIREIHAKFFEKYGKIIGTGAYVDTSVFIGFRKDYEFILHKCKILPSHLDEKYKVPSGSFRDRVKKNI